MNNIVDDEIETLPPRRRISMMENFDIVYNVLYFVYTNRITFSTIVEENEGTPKTCDAEDIYALAHRLDLENLKVKALGFLKQTCNCRNITERIFSKFTALYPEVDIVYSQFFQNHWQEICETSEFAKYFRNLEDECDCVETHRNFRRFRELMKGADLKCIRKTS
jgi:hypothetical protein